VNVVVNWMLIQGKWGAPALGVNGAALATLISRIYMAALLVGVVFVHERSRRSPLWHVQRWIDRHRLLALWRLGLPAAMQLMLEVGSFAAATAFIGRLDAASLAAHQIALNVASVSFMVPLGIASAGAVRVGHAIGRVDPHGAARAGWAAISIAAAFMACAGLSMILFPHALIGVFTTDAGVLSVGVSLLAIAAMFQLFDGIQVASTGVLRGAGDTHTPMVANLVGHWLFGLPLGYVLCFVFGWGAAGLWMGLSAGLIAVGLVLLVVWYRRIVLITQRYTSADYAD
jgi:MATE family multidrug resistance protein